MANFTIDDVTFDEGNSGTNNFVFIVRRDAATDAATITWTFGAGTTSAADFVGNVLPTTGTLSFAIGETTKTISIPVAGDFTIEAAETFTIDLSNPGAGNAITDAQGVGTINNDDTAGAVRISNVTVVEGNSGTTNAVVTLTRIGGNTDTVVSYNTVDNTATAGTDFTATTGTVTFAGGQNTATLTIPITGDTVVEGAETFFVRLTGATNGVVLQNPVGTVGPTADGTVTISEDDSNFALVAPGGGTVAEGSSAAANSLTFTVNRTGLTTSAATLTYTVTNVGGAGNPVTDAADFSGATTGTVSFAAGAASATFTIPVTADFNVEQNEQFTVTLSNPSTGTITTASQIVTLTNDDTAGTVDVNPAAVTVTEGANGTVQAEIILVRSGAGAQAPFSVNVSTQDVNATAGLDYVALTNQAVNFGIGQTSASVFVTINRDFVTENNEVFLVNLSAPTNGAVAGNNGQVTIVDNPTSTAAGTVGVTSISVAEGNSTNTVNVTISRTGGGAAFSVNYATVAGTALAGTDFVSANGTVSFAQGENTRTISIGIVGDLDVEADESFSIQLSNPTNGVALSGTVGTVTIVNDDSAGSGTVVNGNQYYVNTSATLTPSQNYIVFSTQNNAGTEAINLTGNAVAQTIVGNYGTNILTGGGGADTYYGLLGDDTYVVSDSASVVIENPGEGNDTVRTSVSYVLGTNASIETFSATDAAATTAINLQGSTASQRITGNAGDNIINGFGGNDTMVGLGGNDTFLVRGPGDVVIETNGGGFDTVYTTVSYNLGENEVEVLSTVTQSDTTPINLIGNFVSQYVVGNFGENLLNGGSGADTLIGLRGNDLYAVGDSRIIIIEADGEGADTVVSSVDYTLGSGVSVEVLSAQDRATTTALNLRGNGFAQTIVGNNGTNTIDGGLGNDTLVGGGGADRFAFTSALGATNVDTIVDFEVGSDRIGLASNIFGGVGTAVTATNFVIGSAATTADHRIIYNSATGGLFYDADGSGAGAAVQFAQVQAGLGITVSSFEVIAPVAAT